MKKYFAPFLAAYVTCNLFAGGTTGGPWANGAYYPGYLNGKYMGVVTGNNIAGVLGFALVDGAPPFRSATTQSADAGGGVLQNSSIRPDGTQNYFVIFVEGRTYSGLTTAGIDISSKTVAGAMQGTDPAGILPVGSSSGASMGGGSTGSGSLATNISDALSIINRGLSGGFTAKIKCDKAVFTFKGDGQLSTPANRQSWNVTVIPAVVPGFLPPPTIPAGTLTNEYATGVFQTETTPFQIKGIRTSFNASSLQAALDQNEATGAAGGN